MSFVEKIVETIKNPKNVMKSIAEEPLIEEAVMIVGLYAVLGALVAYVQSYKVTYVFEGLENMPSVILFFGVQSAHKLTTAKSAIVAGIPLAISIISLVWSFGSFGTL